MSTPLFDWSEFLDLSDELVSRRGNPAAERTAVSRAYYAAFHRASEHVVRRGERLTFTGDDHARVWNWFLGSTASLHLQWVGGAGRRLRQARRAADRSPRPAVVVSGDARRWVELARQVVAALDGFG